MTGLSWEFMKKRAVAELERGDIREAWSSLSSDLNKSEVGRDALGALNPDVINKMIREDDDTHFWRLLEHLAPNEGLEEDPYESS